MGIKSQRLFIFLVVCLLTFYGTLYGQKNTQKNYNISEKGLLIGIQNYSRPGQNYFSLDDSKPVFVPGVNSFYLTKKIAQPINACYYTDNLGIICRTEWKIDKISPIAVRFRLGSLDQVSYLERKPNSSRPGW